MILLLYIKNEKMTHTECVESESSEKIAKSAIYIDTVISTRSFTIVVSIFLDNNSDRTFHRRLVLGDAPLRTYRLQDTKQANVS